jgi:peptide deformylase
MKDVVPPTRSPPLRFDLLGDIIEYQLSVRPPRSPIVLRIVKYPHPALRHKCKPLRCVDAELKNIVREMFDLMYEQKGVGLAASQVNLPYRLFILNLEGDPAKAPEYVFLNPVISQRGGKMVEADEGCLSFPEIYAPVKRSEKLVLSAYDLSGEELNYELSGFFARAVQHESDHLDGVVFIDRLTPSGLLSIKQALLDLELEFEGDRERGVIPPHQQITARLEELEQLRT